MYENKEFYLYPTGQPAEEVVLKPVEALC